MQNEWALIEVKKKSKEYAQKIEMDHSASPLEDAFLAWYKVYDSTGGSAINSVAVYVESVKIPYRVEENGKLVKKSMRIDVPHLEEVRRAKSVLMCGDEAEQMLSKLGPLVEERRN